MGTEKLREPLPVQLTHLDADLIAHLPWEPNSTNKVIFQKETITASIQRCCKEKDQHAFIKIKIRTRTTKIFSWSR